MTPAVARITRPAMGPAAVTPAVARITRPAMGPAAVCPAALHAFAGHADARTTDHHGVAHAAAGATFRDFGGEGVTFRDFGREDATEPQFSPASPRK